MFFIPKTRKKLNSAIIYIILACNPAIPLVTYRFRNCLIIKLPGNFERNNFRTNFGEDTTLQAVLHNVFVIRTIQRRRCRRTITVVVSFFIFLKRQEGSTYFTGVFLLHI